MIKLETSFEDIDVSIITDVKELQSIRRKLAKRANQRMLRLERASSKVSGESYADFGSIRLAKFYLGDKRRFSESATAISSLKNLRKEINVLQKFLSSKTSTVQGIREIEDARIDAFSSGRWRGGSKLQHATSSSFFDFLSSDVFRKYRKLMSSDILLEMYDLSRDMQSNDEIIDELDQLYDEYIRNETKVSVKELEKRLNIKWVKR